MSFPRDLRPEEHFGFASALALALDVARGHVPMIRSSHCKKSRRGAVIWAPYPAKDRTSALRMAWGTNHRSDARVCDYNAGGAGARCKEDCSKICVHAEQEALARWLNHGPGPFSGSICMHVKINPVNGDLVPSGPPSCVECSKALLLHGINGVMLYHESGWKLYDSHGFHLDTLRTLKLHGGDL